MEQAAGNAYGVGVGTNKSDACFGYLLGKTGILAQKTVSRVNAIDAQFFGVPDYFIGI